VTALTPAAVEVIVGKKPGRPKPGKLADMSEAPPEPPDYELPDPEDCEEYNDGLVLKAENELRTRISLWKSRLIVEFAVMQIVRHNGRWVEVARIDTCHHGSVHKHQLSKSRPDDRVGRRDEIEKIPSTNGWAVVDENYDRALQLMKADWTENLRRWRRGQA
jgi:hypothetical protein